MIMNDFEMEMILLELNELEDILTVSRLLAIRKIKNGDRSGADEMLSDAVRAIESIRDRFFT